MPGLSLAVVGAGIGGLTAALALARRGHAVTLVERRTGFSEVGAGLQLSPNASRILIDLGLGSALSRVATEPDRVAVRAVRTGKAIGGIALGSFIRERFGAPYWVVHRADLQQALLDAVRSESRVRMLIGRKAEDVVDGASSASLTVTTENGNRETLACDGVIAADGVWSRVRRTRSPPKPRYHGYAVWRATLERNRVPPELAGNETGLWLGRRGHVVHYPIRAGKLFNIVAVEPKAEQVEGWSTPGRRIEILRRYNHAAPILRDLLAGPEEWLLWSLFEAPVLGLAGDRTALLGDAAHPVLPFLAQGAALAIEDAATLAAMLATAPDLPQAFRLYAEHRRGRARHVQAEARRNGRIYHLGGPLALARDLVMRRLGPEGMTERYAWLYGYRTPP